MQRNATSLGDEDILTLDELLSSIHAPFEPLDASAVDGYLCGVLLQPVTISLQRWWPRICDVDGRPLPPALENGPGVARIRSLVTQRCAELEAAISARQWFDPWIFDLDVDADPAAADALTVSPAVAAQQPWVAGFSAAMDAFPDLLERGGPATLEPLAVLYAAFDADDLEDAQDLLPIIETLEPPQTLTEAAEDLVRSVLLLADITRPRPGPVRRPRAGQPPGRRPPRR